MRSVYRRQRMSQGQNTLTAILSIALGAIIGELLDLDRRMRSLGDWVQTRTARLIHTEDGAPSISDGFVTASLLFCVGRCCSDSIVFPY